MKGDNFLELEGFQLRTYLKQILKFAQIAVKLLYRNPVEASYQAAL